MAGFPANQTHDPIVYRYDRLNPQQPCLNFLGERWVLYHTPPALHGDIAEVSIVFQASNSDAINPQIRRLTTQQHPMGKHLFCIEGSTGDKGEPNQPHSQSIIGCVLVNPQTDGSYTVHLAFLGSRSGKGSRSMQQAYSDHKAKGNPDWITDFGTDMLDDGDLRSLITNTGSVCRGFAHSIKAILPNLLACFTEISRQMNNQPPKHVYVTGHSLGGALAQHFVSTILMGSVYGPVGQGPEMPNQLHNWPWKQIKLITFGAPSSGDEQWAKTLTTEFLHNYFFSTRFKPTDDSALTITDPQIVERLLDPSQALGWRVLDSTNPITTEKVAGGKHIGKTIYTNTNAGSISSYLQPPSTVSHELVVIREQMCEALSQPSIPPTGWKYYTMQEIHPTRNEKRKGSVEEYRQMMNAIEKFYQTNNMNIDLTSVKSDFDLFIQILGTTP